MLHYIFSIQHLSIIMLATLQSINSIVVSNFQLHILKIHLQLLDNALQGEELILEQSNKLLSGLLEKWSSSRWMSQSKGLNLNKAHQNDQSKRLKARSKWQKQGKIKILKTIANHKHNGKGNNRASINKTFSIFKRLIWIWYENMNVIQHSDVDKAAEVKKKSKW